MNEETLDIIIGLEEEEEGLSFFSFSHKHKTKKKPKNENENEKKQNEKHTNKKFCISTTDRPTDQNECKKISLVEYSYY